MLHDAQIYRSAIGGLGPWELGIILLIVLVIFGAGKLPKIGSSLGQALKNFKKSVQAHDDTDKDDQDTGDERS
jgi:sec-independent protein translocase protein TatA